MRSRTDVMLSAVWSYVVRSLRSTDQAWDDYMHELKRNEATRRHQQRVDRREEELRQRIAAEQERDRREQIRLRKIAIQREQDQQTLRAVQEREARYTAFRLELQAEQARRHAEHERRQAEALRLENLRKKSILLRVDHKLVIKHESRKCPICWEVTEVQAITPCLIACVDCIAMGIRVNMRNEAPIACSVCNGEYTNPELLFAGSELVQLAEYRARILREVNQIDPAVATALKRIFPESCACPRCRNVVIRNGGCNRMRCLCGCQFCIKCGITSKCNCTQN